MLAGMGRTRRALLSDTLLANYTAEEIEMVLAHEAGHHARAHVARSLALEAAVACSGFYLLYAVFDLQRLMDLRFFPSLVFLSYLSNLLVMPLAHTVSRLHEIEADRFALTHYPDLPTFRSLMDKLAKTNLANPSPQKIQYRRRTIVGSYFMPVETESL